MKTCVINTLKEHRRLWSGWCFSPIRRHCRQIHRASRVTYVHQNVCYEQRRVLISARTRFSDSQRLAFCAGRRFSRQSQSTAQSGGICSPGVQISTSALYVRLVYPPKPSCRSYITNDEKEEKMLQP